jgi:hypothetical protein
MRTGLLTLLLFSAVLLHSQERLPSPADPCGLPDTASLEYRTLASGNWGYGYDTLLIDLARWGKSPFVTIDSIGASVQKRTLFMVTISDTATDAANARKRIWIHARTHPNEVQGTWVTNEMIRILLSDTIIGPLLRKRYVFNIVPMYNPDGVELKLDRQNANGIDIESNWNAASPQPEVLVLRSMFEKLMSRSNPIRVMLNMHSSVSGKRYFVYHTATGTSVLYSALEQRFINYVRGRFPGGIEPWNYFVSWPTAPATQYPESWFWFNHRESVLAITYEDINGATARAFDSTAYALLCGANDFLTDTTATTVLSGEPLVANGFELGQNYPNPFNPSTAISYHLAVNSRVSLRVFDLLGREVAVLVDEEQPAGTYRAMWDATRLPSGVYFYRLTAGEYVQTRKMLLTK